MVLDREFPPDIRVENEISALSMAGYEVHIACYTRKNKTIYEKTDTVTIYRKAISDLIYKSSIASLTLPFYFHFWKGFLRKILRSQFFDAVHVHDLPLAGVCAELKTKFDLKLTVDLHENWPAFIKISKHTNTLPGKIFSPVFLWRCFEKKVLQHADNIMVVVDEAKERLVRIGVPANRIYVVSNTINMSGLSVHSPVHREGVILYYAGGLNYHRGLHNMIIALHKTRNRKLKFRILGEGSYKDDLVKLADKLNLNDRVIFMGYQPFSKVMDMLSDADFAVIPHLRNEHTDSTIPHKLFQYMYAGKPVIASDCIPIKRILEETGAGIIYPADNTDDLSELLDQLDSVNYKEMAQKGRKAVTEKYNWNFDSKVLLNLYQDYSSL